MLGERRAWGKPQLGSPPTLHTFPFLSSFQANFPESCAISDGTVRMSPTETPVSELELTWNPTSSARQSTVPASLLPPTAQQRRKLPEAPVVPAFHPASQ